MITQAKVQQEIKSITFCVMGLSFMMIGFFVIADKFDLSVLLGTIVGSLASILNYSLYLITLRISTKYDPKKAALVIVLSKVFRLLLMSAVAFIILIIPMLHYITGIVALFFPQISRVVISILKG
jgi:uncharacterized membrane protein (GlpM family)